MSSSNKSKKTPTVKINESNSTKVKEPKVKEPKAVKVKEPKAVKVKEPKKPKATRKSALKNSDFPYNVLFGNFDKTIIMKDKYKILSIDIGIRNFAYRIEERTSIVTDGIKSYKMKCCVFDKRDLNSNETKLNKETYLNLYKLITELSSHLLDTDLIIIERQLRQNTMASNIQNFIMAAFIILSGEGKINPDICVVDINSKLKGTIFGYTKATCGDLKKWCVPTAIDSLEKFGDSDSINKINTSRKKDDLSDTCIQLEAFVRYLTSNY